MRYLYSSLEYLTPQSTPLSFLSSKLKHFCLILLLLLSWKGFSQTDPNAANTGPTHNKYVVGYYARDFNVSDIEADKLTYLMYAFYDVEFDENNNPLLSSLDDYADFEHTEDPGVSFSNSPRGNFGALKQLKEENPQLNIIMSIGGWTLSIDIPAIADSPTYRAQLVQQMVDLMNQLQNSLSFSAGIPLRFKTPEEAALEALENVGSASEK